MKAGLILSLVGAAVALVGIVVALSARYESMTIVGVADEPAAQSVLFGWVPGGHVFWVLPNGSRGYLPGEYHVPAHLGARVIGRITVSGDLFYATVEPGGVWQMWRDNRTKVLIVSRQSRSADRRVQLVATFEPVQEEKRQ